MNIYWSLLIVVVVLVIAVLISCSLNWSEWRRRLFETVIGVAATFAGVFLGLGLDNIKKDREDRNFAIAALRAYTIGFVQEMRPWHDNVRHFPAIALTTPDPDQQRLFFQNFKEFASLPTLKVPKVSSLIANPQVTKQFDDVFFALLVDRDIRLELADQTFRNADSPVKERYASYHHILQLSAIIYANLCMQSLSLNGSISASDLDAYFAGKMARDEFASLDCSITPWGPASTINQLFRNAGRQVNDALDPYPLYFGQ
jgi:hypothetical protein